MKNFNKNILVWLGIILSSLFLMNIFMGPQYGEKPTEIAYTELLSAVEKGDVAEAKIKPNNQITGRLKNGKAFKSQAPLDLQMVDRFVQGGVKLSGTPQEEESLFMKIFGSSLPLIIILLFWFFAMRQMQGGSGGKNPFSFGKSKAKAVSTKKRVTFKDVAGVEEAKQDITEIVEFLRTPKKFQKLGGKIPRGMLLVGPPGTGKTLLARAVAGEANVPFYSISGSDFVEVFVGVGASRVREMFAEARKHEPCIIFIDEIDAVGRQRGAGYGGGNDEREQTLNQLLVEMDGMEDNDSVIVIAATNRADVLDNALLRPGRFDREINVPLPDVDGRAAILNVHAQKVPLATDVDLKTIARGTPGFSGADLMNLVNEAALWAARHNKKYVGAEDFDAARDKIIMGAARSGNILTEEEKKVVAYHEGGHALVSHTLKEDVDPIHKATIIPRGRALGMVQYLPERDTYLKSRSFILAKIAEAFGGRAAEEIIFGKAKVTTGAGNDIQAATHLARLYVTQVGLSDKAGLVHYDISRYQDNAILGPKTYELIDSEMKKLLDEAYKQAKDILTKNKKQLEAIAQALLTYETITGDEIEQLMAGKKIRQDAPAKKPATKKATKQKKKVNDADDAQPDTAPNSAPTPEPLI